MAASYEDWIATCEETDGIRFSWNNLPTSRIEATRMVRAPRPPLPLPSPPSALLDRARVWEHSRQWLLGVPALRRGTVTADPVSLAGVARLACPPVGPALRCRQLGHSTGDAHAGWPVDAWFKLAQLSACAHWRVSCCDLNLNLTPSPSILTP